MGITRWEYDRCIEDFTKKKDGWLVSYSDHWREVNCLIKALEEINDREPINEGMDPVDYMRWVSNKVAAAIAKGKEAIAPTPNTQGSE